MLIFLISTVVAMCAAPQRKGLRRWCDVLTNTSEQVFPLLATVISVGVLVNIMTATGVRGLIAITFVTLPVSLIYAFALIVLPLAQGSLSYSSGIILGTPLIFLFNSIGVNVTIAKRAGLLHDIGKAIDHEVEGSHVTIGVDLARKYKESEEIVHAIEAHHGDVEPHTVIACIVQAADTISAARPGARRENIENYVKRLEKLEEVTKSFNGVESCYAIQAGREIRIMVKPEEVSEDEMVLLARDIAAKIENELTYPGQIKVHVLRETKAVEYAK